MKIKDLYEKETPGQGFIQGAKDAIKGRPSYYDKTDRAPSKAVTSNSSKNPFDQFNRMELKAILQKVVDGKELEFAEQNLIKKLIKLV